MEISVESGLVVNDPIGPICEADIGSRTHIDVLHRTNGVTKGVSQAKEHSVIKGIWIL